MNDIGMNSSNSSNGNGGSNSDSSMSSGPDSKLCRDFIRNVCHRGKNCKFIHPENIKIRSDPIFCHDFQQNRCHRPTCKFIHCSREIEEHYKKTGELPENVYENENGNGHHNNHGTVDNRGSGRNVDRNSRGSSSNGVSRASNGNGVDNSSDVPVCKDYLKGVCNRPFGACKYRHVNTQNDLPRNGRSSGNGNGNGRTLNGIGKNGGGMRRRGSDGLYDSCPDIKKLRPNENTVFANFGGRAEEFNEDFYVGNNGGQGYSILAPPPPPHSEAHTIQTSQATGHQHVPPTSTHGFSQFHQNPVTSTYVAVAGSNRNGYNGGADNSSVAAYIHSAETIKALEDENFMLKRRIEELKTSNEFLLNQNAQLRLNSSLSVTRTSVGVENAVQVQPAVGVASVASGVVQTMVSMAQPMASLSVAATQPLSTISTLPTVSMPQVSVCQALPVVSIATHQPQPQQAVYPMVTTQGVISQASNLS